MGHFIAPDRSIYVDTDFVNNVQKLPGYDLKHIGFGEFKVVTPHGEIEVDRMRGKPFEGQSGRSHKFYDSKGGNALAEKTVEAMEAKGLSTRAGGESKTASGGYTYKR